MLSDQFEPVSAIAVTLPLMPRDVEADLYTEVETAIANPNIAQIGV